MDSSVARFRGHGRPFHLWIVAEDTHAESLDAEKKPHHWRLCGDGTCPADRDRIYAVLRRRRDLPADHQHRTLGHRACDWRAPAVAHLERPPHPARCALTLLFRSLRDKCEGYPVIALAQA